jgi:hypothetical protein
VTTLDYAKAQIDRRRWLRTTVIVLAWLGGLMLIIAAGGWLLIWLTLRGPGVSLLTFDSPRWKAASAPDPTYNSVRLRMADGFLATRQPVGKTRTTRHISATTKRSTTSARSAPRSPSTRSGSCSNYPEAS